MAKVMWNGAVLAESDRCEVVEGNLYFPPDSIRPEYFQPIDKTTRCFWKGTASYYDIVVNGEVNSGAAWCYADPKQTANHIKEHVAFYRNKVDIQS